MSSQRAGLDSSLRTTSCPSLASACCVAWFSRCGLAFYDHDIWCQVDEKINEFKDKVEMKAIVLQVLTF